MLEHAFFPIAISSKITCRCLCVRKLALVSMHTLHIIIVKVTEEFGFAVILGRRWVNIALSIFFVSYCLQFIGCHISKRYCFTRGFLFFCCFSWVSSFKTSSLVIQKLFCELFSIFINIFNGYIFRFQYLNGLFIGFFVSCYLHLKQDGLQYSHFYFQTYLL